MKRSSSSSAVPMSWPGPAGGSSSPPKRCFRPDFPGSSNKTRKRFAPSRHCKPAEKRLVVELGETAQVLARRYPREAETMVRRLGPEGLTAVRVFGDDVAEVLVKEGPESLGVLRKTGRGGWSFFTKQVLPHKKKLAAAGVLAAFMANPEKFVDYAGQATEFAVREFARAGIQLASAVGGGGGARPRDLDRPGPRRLRTRLPRASLPRHGTGRSGRRPVVPGGRRAAGPLDVSAVRVVDTTAVGRGQLVQSQR